MVLEPPLEQLPEPGGINQRGPKGRTKGENKYESHIRFRRELHRYTYEPKVQYAMQSKTGFTRAPQAVFDRTTARGDAYPHAQQIRVRGETCSECTIYIHIYIIREANAFCNNVKYIPKCSGSVKVYSETGLQRGITSRNTDA